MGASLFSDEVNHLHFGVFPEVTSIIKDTHENASRHFMSRDIQIILVRLEKTGKWTFSFIEAAST